MHLDMGNANLDDYLSYKMWRVDKLIYILGSWDLCFLLCLSSCIDNLWLYLDHCVCRIL